MKHYHLQLNFDISCEQELEAGLDGWGDPVIRGSKEGHTLLDHVVDEVRESLFIACDAHTSFANVKLVEVKEEQAQEEEA